MTEKKGKTKIGHSLEQLQDGLILTLQDKPVLLNGEINEDDDVFENIQKRLQNQAQHNRQLKQKLKILSNAATSHLQAKNQGKKDLLPHYNDYAYKSDQVDLQEGNVVKRSKPKVTKNVGSDFEQKQNVNTQYYERNSKFKQRKKQKTNTSDLLNFLNETAVEKDIKNEEESINAQDLIEQSLDVVRKRRKIQNQKHDNTQIINQDEQLLSKAIKLGRQKPFQQPTILHLIKQQPQQQPPSPQPSPCSYTYFQLNPITFKPPTSKQPQKKTYNITDAAKGTASCLFVNLPSQKMSINVVKKQEKQMPDSFEKIDPQVLEKMKEEVSFLEERESGMGLAGALEFLRNRQLLNKEEQFGRTNDKQSNHNQAGDRIKLEYRNASGKLMKPKQAFRYLSAIFHGQGPSQNKIEKMKKKQLLEMRMKQAASQPGKMMTLLQKHQKQSGQAHMVIQIGSKKKQQ